MIKVKRVYEKPSPQDGKRILIDRLWPRGLKKGDTGVDEWMREIAPSAELRKWFGHDPSKYEDFKKRYFMELEKKKDLIEKIRKEGKQGTVTLIYSAKDTEHNNATVLVDLLA